MMICKLIKFKVIYTLYKKLLQIWLVIILQSIIYSDKIAFFLLSSEKSEKFAKICRIIFKLLLGIFI